MTDGNGPWTLEENKESVTFSYLSPPLRSNYQRIIDSFVACLFEIIFYFDTYLFRENKSFLNISVKPIHLLKSPKLF